MFRYLFGTILFRFIFSAFIGLFCLGLFCLGIFCNLGLFCLGIFCNLGLFCLDCFVFFVLDCFVRTRYILKQILSYPQIDVRAEIISDQTVTDTSDLCSNRPIRKLTMIRQISDHCPDHLQILVLTCARNSVRSDHPSLVADDLWLDSLVQGFVEKKSFSEHRSLSPFSQNCLRS